jgi:cytochrome c peroxidase
MNVLMRMMVGNYLQAFIRKLWKQVIFLTILIPSMGMFSCENGENIEPLAPTPYVFEEIQHFPTELNIPEQNITTVEGVELGRYLFYDGRLSGRDHPDSLMSCGTCHIQSQGFEVSVDHPKFTNGHPFGLPTAEYPEGKKTPHATMPLYNLVYNSSGYLWNGFIHESNTKSGIDGYEFMGHDELNYKYLESLVWMGIVSEHEMAGSIDKTVDMIASIDRYRPMFKAAFGTEEVNIDRISKAIAQFVRTLVANNFKFYKYVRREADLSPSEMRGYELFFSEEADCFHCHSGSLLMTTNDYYNNAKDTTFEDSRDRFAVTNNLMHTGAYRAPSLINCEINGPYMHDGRFKTLDEVIDFYSEGLVYSDYVDPLMKNVRENGVQLSDEEKADLKAFLLTLTDNELLTNPAYGPPMDLGEYLVQ